MADTCFLCAVRSANSVTSPAATTTDEFGTCHSCNVHACPQHGERTGQYFRCSDCITGNSARLAVNPPSSGAQPSTALEPEPPRQHGADRFGAARFFAESPGTALTGLRLYDPGQIDPMRAGLAEWAVHPGPLLDALEQQLTAQLAGRPHQATIALGLPTEQLDQMEKSSAMAPTNLPVNMVDEVALARVDLIFEELRSETTEDNTRATATPELPRVTEQRAAYALAVLCSALVARASTQQPIESVDTAVTSIPGGLTMPPFVVLLSLLLRYGRVTTRTSP